MVFIPIIIKDRKWAEGKWRKGVENGCVGNKITGLFCKKAL